MSDNETDIRSTTGKVAFEERGRGEVPASTLARMMGVATVADLKLLDSKLELLATKVGSLVAKFDRFSSVISNLPSTNDMDRLEAQLAQIRALFRDGEHPSKPEARPLRETVVSGETQKDEEEKS